MAVPTIASVSPSTIWTGGQVIVVTGTSFRLPVEPGPYDGILPEPISTVQVLVDGVAATDVWVLSATKLACRAPSHEPGVPNPTAEPPVTGMVSVVVKNCDDAGLPITGETATKTNALLYARPDLSVEDDGTRVERQIIRLMKREILENVVKNVHPDYGEYPFQFTFLADTPAISLLGPRVLPDPEYGTQMKIEVPTSGGLVDLHRRPDTVRMDFDLIGYANNNSQNLSLLLLTKKFFQRNPFLYLDRNKANPSAGQIAYRMEVPLSSTWNDTTTPNPSGIHSFSGSFSVRGVNLEDMTSFPGESLQDKDVGRQTSEAVDLGEVVLA